MRSPARYALAVLVALAAGEAVLRALEVRPWALAARPLLLALIAWLLARTQPRDRVLGGSLIVGSVIVEEALGVLTGSFAAVEPALLAAARGFGLYLAGRGERRLIDGALLAGPVVILELLLASVKAIRGIGHDFAVATVTPHLGAVIASGAAIAALLPLIQGRQRDASAPP